MTELRQQVGVVRLAQPILFSGRRIEAVKLHAPSKLELGALRGLARETPRSHELALLWQVAATLSDLPPAAFVLLSPGDAEAVADGCDRIIAAYDHAEPAPTPAPARH